MRWLLAVVLVGGCHSEAKQPVGPLWTPAMFNTLHGLTPDCDQNAQVWTCRGDSTTSKVVLDADRHLISVEVTDLTRMSDEPAPRFRVALKGIAPPAAIDAMEKHLQTAWPTETEKVAGVDVIVTRTQKAPNQPTLFDVTIKF
jgi:hypothetical protein